MKTTILIVVLLAVGIIGSVKEYKQWRVDETSNYGQGPLGKTNTGDTKLSADKLYQNDVAGFRIKYPSSWEVVANPKFSDGKYSLSQIARMDERAEVVLFGGRIRVSVVRNSLNFTDLVDQEARKMEMVREREYLNTEKVSIVILTWKQNGRERQTAFAHKGGDKVFVLEQDGVGGWEEVLRSMVIL